VKKILALATALTVVLLLSVGPVAAQTYPTAIDRNSVVLTYWPIPGGTSAVSAGVSYQFNPQWDALLSYRSGPVAGTTQFTLGGRYHVRPPSPGFDVFGTLQYASPSPGTSYLMVGGGLVQHLAPGLKSYMILNYAFLPAGAVIVPNLGVTYELSRQASLVAGIDLGSAIATGSGYLGVSFDFSVR
jgi:hypothetical protein